MIFLLKILKSYKLKIPKNKSIYTFTDTMIMDTPNMHASVSDPAFIEESILENWYDKLKYLLTLPVDHTDFYSVITCLNQALEISMELDSAMYIYHTQLAFDTVSWIIRVCKMGIEDLEHMSSDDEIKLVVEDIEISLKPILEIFDDAFRKNFMYPVKN